METKAINWERGSVYIKSHSMKGMKGADPNWGPQENNVQSSSVSFSLDLDWSPMSFGLSLPIIDWKLFQAPITGSYPQFPAQGKHICPAPGSVFYQCAPKLLCCSPASTGQVEMTMRHTSRLLCCSKPRHKWRHSQMKRKTLQGQQIPKAKSSGGTQVLGWFIWFVGQQLFL